MKAEEGTEVSFLGASRDEEPQRGMLQHWVGSFKVWVSPVAEATFSFGIRELHRKPALIRMEDNTENGRQNGVPRMPKCVRGEARGRFRLPEWSKVRPCDEHN